MSQAQTKPTVSAVESKGAPAPVAGNTTTAPKAPAEKTDRRVLGGPALDRLIAMGAVLVPLASKGKLHSAITSQLGAFIAAKDLASKVAGLAKSWDKFDRGYLVGPSASYSACAVNTGSKKAKASPAFVWAVNGKDGIQLVTADGVVWTRPAKGEREQGVYDAALSAVTAAFK